MVIKPHNVLRACNKNSILNCSLMKCPKSFVFRTSTETYFCIKTSKMRTTIFLFSAIYFCVALVELVKCENGTDLNKEDSVQEFVEQGRTFAHKALKRFMIIAPAIFFKLGIAFTLLLLVTLVAVNNGFIGFLILVVGLSSVLARLQGSSAPLVQHVPIPYASVPSLPQIAHHHHPWIDRSDSVDASRKPSSASGVNGYSGSQGFGSNSDLRYTGAYFKNYLSDAKVV